MLKIFNRLRPFIEDVYREISVREYSKEVKISPPTASKQLKELDREGLLISNQRGIYLYFRANRESYLFKQLARLYWYSVLYHITKRVYEELSYKRIILFGSLSKAENTKNSDIDLFLDISPRKIDTLEIQKVLKRAIQLHFSNELKNKYLKENIEQGILIR
ncbi:ArsR family transcriptional regulator [Candidatus Woesearchaeota archaeon]|nr:ArsR family transcriptional regulator [Candidatus Woesearchaeota archaeon]